jgi:hypothetical protein
MAFARDRQQTKDYLSWSVLGELLNEGVVRRLGRKYVLAAAAPKGGRGADPGGRSALGAGGTGDERWRLTMLGSSQDQLPV